jgi:hypothetical protein
LNYKERTVDEELDEVIKEILWRRVDLYEWWVDYVLEEEEE